MSYSKLTRQKSAFSHLASYSEARLIKEKEVSRPFMDAFWIFLPLKMKEEQEEEEEEEQEQEEE